MPWRFARNANAYEQVGGNCNYSHHYSNYSTQMLPLMLYAAAIIQQCRQRYFLVICKLAWTASKYVVPMLYQCRWMQGQKQQQCRMIQQY